MFIFSWGRNVKREAEDVTKAGRWPVGCVRSLSGVRPFLLPASAQTLLLLLHGHFNKTANTCKGTNVKGEGRFESAQPGVAADNNATAMRANDEEDARWMAGHSNLT